MYSINLISLIGFVLFSGLACFPLIGQENLKNTIENDSVQIIQLKEIIVFANPHVEHLEQNKPLSSIEEYLENSQQVKMIKRGAYAWEPNLNGMSSERLSVTIDGMQIFGACTDKMDPITSYVNVSNLSEAHISHGQSGNEFGNTIGGGLDLKLRKGKFIPRNFILALESGFESNNSLIIGGVSTDWSNDQFYLNTDLTYRNAENYFDGNGDEVLFSQFTKWNAALNAGWKIAEGKSIHSTLIYDKATDVGYPALPMDVSLAEAWIGSLSYEQKTLGSFKNWETKFYFNTITHVMDDTTRPDVPIHMDMPGWSKTLGAFSKMEKNLGHHLLKININAYLNNSIAEMTMYPVDPSENTMFMYTWPDVNTNNFALYLSDFWQWQNWDFELNLRLASHHNIVRNDFGINSLRIFYPEMSAEKSRFLKSFGLTTHRAFSDIHFNASLGYGERAPSVSEAYGFYLFNSFDQYDYVGNPDLPNESSFEARLNIDYHLPKLMLGASADYFHIRDFIIGKINPNFAPMTIGASGIKVYENLEYAQISNFKFYSDYQLNNHFHWKTNFSYHFGKDQDGAPLPLISPFNFGSNLGFSHQKWNANLAWQGNSKQTEFSEEYGEDETPAYHLFHFNIGKSFQIGTHKLVLKSGVQNIFNTYFTTFSDWNNIPRMGRNFFLHASFTIK